jgi:carboxymethylenebutenolidase
MAEIENSTVPVGELSAYLARPVGGSASGMLLLPMITGIGEQVREYADTLAGLGITALTWDPFHGPSTDDHTVEQLLELYAKFDDTAVLAEQTALLDHLLGELGCAKAGVIGWCLGGRFALLLAGRDQRVANVVAYHPTVTIPPAPNHDLDAAEYAARITAPVMMLYPGSDTLVSKESFERLQSAVNSREKGASIVHVYPDAEHGFSARARQANPVNAEAWAISWPQALEFIRVTTAE